jgi:hypothetical protein
VEGILVLLWFKDLKSSLSILVTKNPNWFKVWIKGLVVYMEDNITSNTRYLR